MKKKLTKKQIEIIKKRKKKEREKFLLKHYPSFRLCLSFFFIFLVFIYFMDFNYYIFFNNEEFNLLNSKYFNITKKEEFEKPEIEYHVSLEVEDDYYNIYAPINGRSGYRYGPSIIYYEDGTMDAYFASNADNVEWDWITYRHFDGETWSNEKIVLQPTGDSYDHYSCCDPGVIYFNGYYYLGYTSTIVETSGGINNNGFVARSTSPDGPFEKWNGSGWGGDPKAIIYYDEYDGAWGAGELSFVIKDEKLYVYNTWICPEGNFTKVSIGDLSENWPATLEDYGVVMTKISGQDSVDVVYADEIDKFLAFATEQRFTNKSGIVVYESSDGINFKKCDLTSDNVLMHCHNMGISKKLDGHISINDDLLIGYAYSNSSSNWGKWATVFQKINLKLYTGQIVTKIDEEAPTYVSSYTSKYPSSGLIGISVNNRIIRLNEGKSKSFTVYGFNSSLSKSTISSGLTYEYDEEVISIKGNVVKALKEGSTDVKIYYKDFYTTLKVNVYNDDINLSSSDPSIISLEPINGTYTIHLSDSHYTQIRALVKFDNGKWGESYNDYTYMHYKYPAMVDAGVYYMNFEVENPLIISVNENGIITPIKVGKTKVKVSIDDYSFEIDVVVKK